MDEGNIYLQLVTSASKQPLVNNSVHSSSQLWAILSGDRANWWTTINTTTLKCHQIYLRVQIKLPYLTIWQVNLKTMRASHQCPGLQGTTEVQHRAQCSETNNKPLQAPFVTPTLLDLCCAVLLLSMLMESHFLLPHLHPAFTFITCPALIRSWSGDVSLDLSDAVVQQLAVAADTSFLQL